MNIFPVILSDAAVKRKYRTCQEQLQLERGTKDGRELVVAAVLGEFTKPVNNKYSRIHVIK